MKDRLELWGGVECTVNRVGDVYIDQCARTGHDDRIGDLDLIAGLGINVLRYPIIWEKIAPDGLDNADWSATDRRMQRLRELGIEPIAGLVHHGSGPPTVDLLHDDFAGGLADFARAVAQRYPWIRYFTPVNEPLTTARFSALYGHWYPHLRDKNAFLRALLNECRAIVLSMQAIREVIPNAQLVQTEDMGKTYSTPELSYQAAFENERRWLSLDLLCGRRLNPHIYGYIREAGISDAELDWFYDNIMRPDVIGINHYVTSERYLDHRYQFYPAWSHGGNGKHSYADVHATRVQLEIDNIHGILREAWQRYHLPLSITEAHLGDRAEEQQRWLWERWQAATQCRLEGINVRAVTVWAMFGSFDWNTLLVEQNDFYESGVFDISSGVPVRTALADLVEELARNGSSRSPVLNTPGWWRRPDGVHWRLPD